MGRPDQQTPVSATSSDEVDARLLRQLVYARRPGHENPLRARNLTAQLLDPYWRFAKNIIRGRLMGVSDPEHDAEEVAVDVLKRLARALENKQRFNKPFRRVVLDNIDWALKDYWKSPARDDESDPHDLEGLVPPSGVPGPPPSLVDQARAFDSRLEGLSERDRRIIVERLYVGRSPEEVAEVLGVSREACDTAFSRAVARLREGTSMADVRNRSARSAREAG